MQTEKQHEHAAPGRVGKRASVQTEILVVEDEAIVAEDIRTTLQGMGYSVPRTAASGEEAVRTASENAPALALLDIRLQGHIDGIGAAEQLRALGVPVVFLSSYSDEPTLQRARAAQPFGYLLKPFDERELRATIEMALYKHGMDVKLADRERWFSTTLQSIRDGVVTADRSQCVSFMNQAAEVLSGWKGRDAVGRPLDDVLRIVDARTGQAQPPPPASGPCVRVSWWACRRTPLCSPSPDFRSKSMTALHPLSMDVVTRSESSSSSVTRPASAKPSGPCANPKLAFARHSIRARCPNGCAKSTRCGSSPSTRRPSSNTGTLSNNFSA